MIANQKFETFNWNEKFQNLITFNGNSNQKLKAVNWK